MKVASVCAILFGVIGLSDRARGQIPEGYEVVQMTRLEAVIRSKPELTNRSEIVWATNIPPSIGNVFRYKDGVIIRISAESTYDARPKMNDDGLIAWMQGDDWNPPLFVAYYEANAVDLSNIHSVRRAWAMAPGAGA